MDIKKQPRRPTGSQPIYIGKGERRAQTSSEGSDWGAEEDEGFLFNVEAEYFANQATVSNRLAAPALQALGPARKPIEQVHLTLSTLIKPKLRDPRNSFPVQPRPQVVQPQPDVRSSPIVTVSTSRPSFQPQTSRTVSLPEFPLSKPFSNNVPFQLQIGQPPEKKARLQDVLTPTAAVEGTSMLQAEVASVRSEVKRKDEELEKLKRELEASRRNADRELALLKEQHKADHDRLRLQLNLKNQELAIISNSTPRLAIPSSVPFEPYQDQPIQVIQGHPRPHPAPRPAYLPSHFGPSVQFYAAPPVAHPGHPLQLIPVPHTIRPPSFMVGQHFGPPHPMFPTHSFQQLRHVVPAPNGASYYNHGPTVSYTACGYNASPRSTSNFAAPRSSLPGPGSEQSVISVQNLTDILSQYVIPNSRRHGVTMPYQQRLIEAVGRLKGRAGFGASALLTHNKDFGQRETAARKIVVDFSSSITAVVKRSVSLRQQKKKVGQGENHHLLIVEISRAEAEISQLIKDTAQKLYEIENEPNGKEVEATKKLVIAAVPEKSLDVRTKLRIKRPALNAEGSTKTYQLGTAGPYGTVMRELHLKDGEMVSVVGLTLEEGAAQAHGTLFSQANGLTTTSSVLKFVCPFTKQRLQRPVRGKECKHIECFGLEEYCTINRGPKAKFRCPLCNVQVALTDFVQDDFFLDLMTFTVDERRVELSKGGNSIVARRFVKQLVMEVVDIDVQDDVVTSSTPED